MDWARGCTRLATVCLVGVSVSAGTLTGLCTGGARRATGSSTLAVRSDRVSGRVTNKTWWLTAHSVNASDGRFATNLTESYIAAKANVVELLMKKPTTRQHVAVLLFFYGGFAIALWGLWAVSPALTKMVAGLLLVCLGYCGAKAWGVGETKSALKREAGESPATQEVKTNGTA